MLSPHNALCGLGAAALLCAFSARASTFVRTGTPTSLAGSETAFTTAGGAATVLAQRFTLTETVTIESVSVYGAFHGGIARIWFHEEPDLGDWRGNNLHSNAESHEPPDPGVVGWHAISLIDAVTLNAGEHTFSLGSDDTNGFEWGAVDASTGVGAGARGRGVFPAATGGLLFFESAPNAPIFAIRIHGHTPSPGGVALAALVGAGCLGRRR